MAQSVIGSTVMIQKQVLQNPTVIRFMQYGEPRAFPVLELEGKHGHQVWFNRPQTLAATQLGKDGRHSF